MGRIRYMLYQFARILPRGYRKPVYTITSVLGLIIFLNFMVSITHSPYLIEAQKAIYAIQNIFIDNGTMPVFLLLVCLLLYWASTKRYRQFQTIISLGYLLIFVFAFLPMIVRL